MKSRELTLAAVSNCLDCKSEQLEDDMFWIMNGYICQNCIENYNLSYECEDCGSEFDHKGLALACPTCKSQRLYHPSALIMAFVREKRVRKENRSTKPTQPINKSVEDKMKKSNGTPEPAKAAELPTAIPPAASLVEAPKILQPNQLIRDIKTVQYLDDRAYKFTFLDNSTRWIWSVTTKLSEYREKGIERYREQVGTEEANEALNEGGRWGGIVHHCCFLLATGGAVLFEPPAYQTVGIGNEDVAELVKQNEFYRQQFTLRGIPYLTVSDQYRYLQVRRFKSWMDIVKPEVLYAETRVYSLTHDIAGRIDFLFRVKEGDYMIAGTKPVHLPEGIILPDVKSGEWSDKYWYQLGAYRTAIRESLGIDDPIPTVGIHLKAKTNTGLNTLVHTPEQAEHDLVMYKHVAAIFDEKYEGKEPVDFSFESVLLSDQARGAIALGQILPNPVAERQVTESTISSN